ncbi:hypothetical protein ACO0SA_001551 [Hanseniaspora valbyensis]
MSIRPQRQPRFENKNPNISTIASLKKGPFPDDCLRMLYSLSHKVSKLMHKNNLRIIHLQEFHPKQENLLGMNVNKGSKILLRLRHNKDPYLLMDEESVLDTLLHELVHNSIGPHNTHFHKLWEDYRQQQWANLTLGLYNNFLGKGARLGGRINNGSGSIGGNVPLLKIGGRQINMNKSASEMARISALQRFEEHNKNFCSNQTEEDEVIDDDDLRIIHLDDDDEIKEIIVLDSDDIDNVNVKEPELKKRKIEVFKNNKNIHPIKKSKEEHIEVIELSD